eukprot:TRINITY_DN14440_c0_g2_i1.p1 TRINITY_DN14440_c0_g2~~TRINITY_DN14440_c0_g2_i1.p1  ORF type:complete len:498 (+),score=72.99 TRINITY_DN14440_c0_g2_i1:63-1496(+)
MWEPLLRGRREDSSVSDEHLRRCLNLPIHSGAASSSGRPAVEPPASSCSPQSSCPASFKAGRHRKTKQYIQEQRSRSNSIASATPQSRLSDRYSEEDLADPRLQGRLEEDEEAARRITAGVAALIHSHFLEGEGARGPRDPSEDEFHEAHYLRKPGPLCACCKFLFPRLAFEEATVENVYDFVQDIAYSLYFCKQVLVLGVVYIERLLKECPLLYLTARNWRSLLAIALLVASKVWEDVHPWNADLDNCLRDIANLRYKQGALYRLESLFLHRLGWRVFVPGETYAAYYFTLMNWDSSSAVADGKADGRPTRLRSLSALPTIKEDAGNEFPQSDAETGEADTIVLTLQDRDGDSTSRTSNASGDDSLTARTIREAWTLDASNPHIGRLRHAPPALAPSPHIQQSSEHLSAHRLAASTCQMVHRRPASGAGFTLSGATGSQLAHELRGYLESRKAMERLDENSQRERGEGRLSALFET